MNKVVIKEFEKKHLGIDIMLYVMFIVLGFALLNFPFIDEFNPTEYAPQLFYMLAFFSLLAYFLNRREDDYEKLIFGFINVCVGTFVLVYAFYPETGFILADAVLIYSIAIVVNKGYYCKKLLEERNLNFFSKTAVTILLLVLGVFVVSSIYNKVEASSMILGYYFIVYGLLSLLEPFMEILINGGKVKKTLFNFLSYDEKEEEKESKSKSAKKEDKKESEEKVEHKIKEVKKSKPTVKSKAEGKSNKNKTTKKENKESKKSNE